MDTPRRRRRDDDPYAVLGLSSTADESAITAARRRLAKQAHPDAGGSIERMQTINEAADRAIATLGSGRAVPSEQSTEGATRSRARTPRPAPRYRGGAVRHDHPSFTIEALPVEAFEGLLIAASWLGTAVDDDPPALLEVVLDDPSPAWCRLQLVPDAGSTTVSLTVAAVPGSPIPDVDEVRDRWIAALNGLNWGDLDPMQPQPW